MEMQRSAPPTAPAWVGLVEQGLRMAAEEDLGGLDAGVVGEGLTSLLRLGDLVQAQTVRWLRQFERSDGPAREGAPSTVAWVSARGRRAPGTAAELVCVGRQLEKLEETARALNEGHIGYQHASLIAHLASQVGPEAAAAIEDVMVDAARETDVRRFASFVRQVRECVDPDGALGGANKDHEHRRLHLSQTLGGRWRLDGWLDVEGGATVATALNALMKPLPDDRRTTSQRRADALVELSRRQLDGGRLPTTGGQRPHVVVTVPVETQRAEPGSPGGVLRWGGPVVGEVARRLACDALETAVGVGEDGVPVAVTRPRRTIPAWIRRLLVARDDGCVHPDCDRPPEWCDGHHVIPRAADGPTTVENLALLCRKHHGDVHEGGWRMRRTAEGRFEFVPPPGRSP